MPYLVLPLAENVVPSFPGCPAQESQRPLSRLFLLFSFLFWTWLVPLPDHRVGNLRPGLLLTATTATTISYDRNNEHPLLFAQQPYPGAAAALAPPDGPAHLAEPQFQRLIAFLQQAHWQGPPLSSGLTSYFRAALPEFPQREPRRQKSCRGGKRGEIRKGDQTRAKLSRQLAPHSVPGARPTPRVRYQYVARPFLLDSLPSMSLAGGDQSVTRLSIHLPSSPSSTAATTSAAVSCC